MTEVVEGEWKQFVFKMATPKDYPALLAHLRKVYYREEPLCKLGGFSNEMAEELDQFVKYYLGRGDDLCFVAVDKATGQVAGARVTFKISINDPPLPLEFKTRTVQGFMSVIDKLGEMANMNDRFGVASYADFFMTSVDPDFRQQGLVSEIYRRSIALLRNKGFPVVKVICTSPHTLKAVTNLGFSELGRISVAEHSDETGKLYFPTAPTAQVATTLALKL